MTLSPLYLTLLRVYHYFPLHSPVTLWLVNGAWGRFSAKGGKEGWYLDGNKAWAAMEVVSPLTFITTVLCNCDVSGLSTGSKIAICMYLLHYSIRAIISPLILAPQRAPQHASVTLSAMGFNLMNGYIMGGWLAEDSGRGVGERFGGWSWVAVVGWAVGLAGNVYHDEILHSLRGRALIFDALPSLRPNVPADASNTKVHVKQDDKEENKTGGKVYEIPQGGLFYWVTFPNYLCEWFEWTCYAILTSSSLTLRSPAPALLISQAQKRQYPEFVVDLVRLVGRLPLPSFTTSNGLRGQEALLLSPPWMFLVALLAAMIPRAINGQRWYEQTFGARWRDSGRKGGRWVCLPGLL